MTKKEIKNQYQLWLLKATSDNDVKEELEMMANDYAKIEEIFCSDLAFGTGGLRGLIGAGTNRMNVHTVAKVSQGLANYVINHFDVGKRRIAVSYDNRIKSETFAKVSSGVFAANGINVFLYSELMPTPCLSFAVRELNCSAGIMITASHNSSKYNGYKVYGADGCQITTAAAEEILAEIEKLKLFTDVKTIGFEAAQASGKIQYISRDITTTYIETVKKQSLLRAGETINKNISIVYSPLNGTGLKPVLRILKESGYTNIKVVKEQEQPDGNFPTCPSPNPEIRETMALGIEYAKKYHSDLFLATDPDCDRVGISVKNLAGEYVLLSGNETGILLLDYICSRRLEMSTMPKDPVMIKTIVTIDMAEQIATHFGVRTINVLTGFKYIGEQIGMLQAKGKADSFIFGFEESYGYLSGSYVRDKDAIDGVFMICEMFAYYKTKGFSLYEKLEELYNTYGFSLNTLYSYEFDGSSGFTKMQDIMQKLRSDCSSLGSMKIERCLDYAEGLDGLPKSDVLKFFLVENCSIVIRPSGTEPKLKAYISISATSREEAENHETKIADELKAFFS